ncbi:hypothetical protein FKO01_41055 [Mesorhizobium sp. B2-3-3]|nr:hypothetical protein FKO01_41055 [Mesorhizobium sp. B2-3-3]
MLQDKKALQILLDAYWSSDGWKRGDTIGPADFEYARQAGYMFDPVEMSHDDIVGRLLAVRNRIGIKQVADAFLASLSTRRLELRSALGSFSFAAHFPDHPLVEGSRGPMPSGPLRCRLCGLYSHPIGEQQDLNVLSFERWKWGGVRHLNPLYGWFDLAQFEKANPPDPTQEDYSILARIVEIASGLPPKAKPNELEKRIGKVIRSNGSERRVLIEILGLCGVLKPADRCGFLDAFTSDEHRDRPPDHTNDWGYPVIWWQGVDGVNKDAVNRLFPEIGAV